MQTIAVLGLGKMGRGIALRFIQKGYKVFVWNRSPDKAAALLNAGAVWLENPGEAGLHTNIVFSIVADDVASEVVWLGEKGALQNMSRDSFVIECSTLSLDHVKYLASKAAERGLHYIDCPVTGLPDAALNGVLTLLVGAEQTSLVRIKTLLNEISVFIRYFGTVGSGTAYKLMINLMGAVQIAALAEGIVLAERLGLDPEVLIAAIENSAAASPQVIRYARSMVERNFSDHPAFTIELRLKDAGYGMLLANSVGSPALLGNVALSCFAAADEHDGHRDEACVIKGMM